MSVSINFSRFINIHEILEHSQMTTENKIFLAATNRVPTVLAVSRRPRKAKVRESRQHNCNIYIRSFVTFLIINYFTFTLGSSCNYRRLFRDIESKCRLQTSKLCELYVQGLLNSCRNAENISNRNSVVVLPGVCRHFTVVYHL